MNKNNTWLYDENGKVRKELYQMSAKELDSKQVEVLEKQDEHNPAWSDEPASKGCDPMLWPVSNPALKALKMGDVVVIKPSYVVAKQFGGRMTFIAFAGVAGGAPPSKCMFCRTKDGGGGFIGTDMLVDPQNPTGEPEEPIGSVKCRIP